MAQMSQVVLSIPKQLTSPDEYYSNACYQLLEILEGKEGLQKTRMAAYMCLKLLKKSTDMGEKYVTNPILKPIMRAQLSNENTKVFGQENTVEEMDLDGNPIVVSERDLELALARLQILMTEARADSWFMDRISTGMLLSHSNDDLLAAFRPLFFLYQFTFFGSSGLKTVLSDILTSFLRHSEESILMASLKSLAFKPTERLLRIVNGSSGGIALSRAAEPHLYV